MSKVFVNKGGFKESFQVPRTSSVASDGTITYTVTETFIPGQFFRLSKSTPTEAVLASGGSDAFGFSIDSSTELSTAPSGSLVTLMHGGGKYFINHADDSATKAYDTSVENASIGDRLFVGASGKLTSNVVGEITGEASGSVTVTSNPDAAVGVISLSIIYNPAVAQVLQVPAAANDYELGIKLLI